MRCICLCVSLCLCTDISQIFELQLHEDKHNNGWRTVFTGRSIPNQGKYIASPETTLVQRLRDNEVYFEMASLASLDCNVNMIHVFTLYDTMFEYIHGDSLKQIQRS